jgi:hypothetical protein
MPQRHIFSGVTYRVDLKVAAPRELGFVPGMLELRSAQLIGLFDASGDLVLHGECDLDRCRRERSSNDRPTAS